VPLSSRVLRLSHSGEEPCHSPTSTTVGWLGSEDIIVSSLLRAIERNLALKVVPPAELDLPLLSARLADLPYKVDSAETIARGVATLLQESRLLHYQDQALMETHAVWFLCEGRRSASAAKAMFLVFRGTGSPTDMITDVMFRPGYGPNGVRCHGGFLRTVREDATLHATLMTHLPGCDELYILGHSLGGALSQVVAGAGFLPKGFGGRLQIVTLGGPLAFFGTPDAAAFDAPTAGAHVLSVVNANDIVPRLLGCPLSFSRKLLSFFAANTSYKMQREHEAILDLFHQYQGFPGYKLLFLHGGKAYDVPPKQRHLVLHLAEALHPCCISDHLTYVAAAEAAAGAEPWAPCWAPN
jgi:hypothetical protein